MSIAIENPITWEDIVNLYTTLRNLQSQKGITQTNIPTGGVGTQALAEQASTLRTEILNLGPTTALPAEAAIGTLITADYLNGLQASLESVPTFYYLFQENVGPIITWTPTRSHYVTAAGWAPDVWSSASVGTDKMYLKGTTAYVSETESHTVSATIKSANVNLTNYSNLYIECTAANSVRIRVLAGSTAKITQTDSTKSRHTRTISISSLTGNHLIEFYATGSSQGAHIYNVYLE